MTDEDLTRLLREVQHSSRDDRNKKRVRSMSDIARETGISRDHLQRIASGFMRIGTKTRTALRTYFDSDCKDDVRFHPLSPVETEHGTRISVILDRFGIK
jgi:hypothetical protein